MERYKNLGGDSGVSHYEISDSAIKIQFKDGAMYLYNNNKPGLSYVEQMKILALRGQGLNSLISRAIRKNYAAKLK